MNGVNTFKYITGAARQQNSFGGTINPLAGGGTLLTFPALTAASLMLLFDRHLGTSFFVPAEYSTVAVDMTCLSLSL